MQRKSKAILAGAVFLAMLLLAGIAGVSIQADEPLGHLPNDRANHHPLDPNG